MSINVINIGSSANDGTGDPLRTAFDKLNLNSQELYDLIRAQGNVEVTTGNTVVAFTSALASTSYSIVIFDINGVGVSVASQTVNGFTVTSLGDGLINYIAILNF